MTGNQDSAGKQNPVWRAFWVKIIEMNTRKIDRLEEAQEPDGSESASGAAEQVSISRQEEKSEPKSL